MQMKMEISFPGGKRVFSDYNGFTVETDQSEKDGGNSSAPTPSDLFFASIGTCAGIYAVNFCEKRDIDPNYLKIEVDFQAHQKSNMIEKVIFNLDIAPEFPEKYIPAIIKSMNLCYVKKHFEQPPQFEFVTNNGVKF
jgi:ribosomal protein S12 methylthiotransferase accessory factor